jgi:AcrR family transcriptional regulator
MSPRQRLSEDVRRAQILNATIAVIADVGYENASLARIAERAQVSKGLVSHHFTDKDRLMEAVVTTTLTALRDAVAASVDVTAPVPEVIRAAIHRAAGLRSTHRSELLALRQIVTGLRAADGTQRFGLGDYEETYLAQEGLFRRGQDEGTLREFDTRVMAVTYQGAIDMMLTYLDEHPEADAAHYADELADLLIAAMRKV